MDLSQLIAQARIRLDDRKVPYLWSDADITLYLNEAQREATERSLCIYDKVTPAICQIALVEGQTDYPLDVRVIDVDVAQLRTGRRPLCRGRELGFDRMCKTRTGPPQEYIVFDAGNQLWLRVDRLPPDPTTLPTDTYTPIIDLHVYRRPLQPLAGDTDVPELREDQHLNLLYWVQYLAFTTRDSDAGDSDRAALGDARFTAAFGAKIDANVKRKQLRHRAPVCRVHH